MKCIECDHCKKGWFPNQPSSYVCTGVKHPFVVENVNRECTERSTYVTTNVTTEDNSPGYYVNDDGIYRRVYYGRDVYQCIMTREMFVEAYNKWIKGENYESN